MRERKLLGLFRLDRDESLSENGQPASSFIHRVHKDIGRSLADSESSFPASESRCGSQTLNHTLERPLNPQATASEQTPLFKSLITTWSFSPASSLSPHASASNPGQSPSSSSASSSSTSRTPNSSTPASPHQGPTLLNIDLAFAFANPLHRIASQAVLPRVADKMVEAFEKRCVEVWGKGRE